MREIQLYNTLSGKKEKFEPLDPSHVKLYACGVTVYDDCHIGHAMQAIYFDVIRSYLEYIGYKVTYVRNYTDVDDKIIKRSQDRGITPKALVDEIIASSERDMQGLGVRPATHEPRVSESIPEIIDIIKDLEKNGYAYSTSEGDVYYRVRKKADYGKLSNRKTEELQSGTRDLVKGDKEDELDFALWKKDDVEGASWDSPWGRGRPGWHIECSAMAKMYLGKSFDIHGGGRDLVFPHHENEIAQSEAANSCAYSTYWMHSGLLTINKTKMSKSLGNQILTSKFLQRFPGEVLRLAYLQNHYTSNVDFSEQVFRSAAQRLLYFYETMRELDIIAQAVTGPVALLSDHKPKDLIEAFHREMTNDFGTVGALRDILIAFRKANELRKGKKSPAQAHTAQAYTEVFRELFGVFGMLQAAPESFIQSLKSKIVSDLGIEESKIESLIADRKAARDAKDWARGDELRKELTEMGIELMDGPEGTRWTILWKEEV
ncbi:MAG: cysteine--tRNA ligase [Proteobacteria bacterium]|nr:MAG: cysteine--tRNA ligase [Pseudomonadota bacterium]